jgi:glycosyltransferase involved in cell wall biosynthesis/spore maturation protein CgeB
MTGPYRILLLDTKSENPNHYICLAVQRALQINAEVELLVKAELHNALALAQEHQCNLFFAFDGEELERGICARLSAICGRSVLWVTEDPYEVNVNVANSALFDLVFTNDSASVSAYGAKGRHLPLAGARPFHFLPTQPAGENLRYDIFFAGTAWPNRVSLVKDLLDADWGTEPFKAKIALPTNPHLPRFELDLPQSQVSWRTSPADFARFANRSVATLVLPRVFSSSGERNFAETPPPRLFEAALAGTVQLVQSNIVEADRYFEPGRDFLYFDTASELIDSVRMLRAKPMVRHEMAVHAQEKALAQHCYEHRMDYVLAQLRELSSTLPARAVTLAPTTSTKQKLLFVAHNVIEHGHFGGVEVYLKLISHALKAEHEVFFYVPLSVVDSSKAVLLDEHGKTVQEFSFSQATSLWQLSCPEREAAFSSVLDQYGFTHVHFHHLINHVPSLVEIAKALGMASSMTFHDYFAVCHNFTLLSFKGSYCHPDKISLSQCDVCLWNGHHVLPGSQAVRRAYWDSILGKVDHLVFNTQGGYELTAKIYPAVAAHQKVFVLPVPLAANQGHLAYKRSPIKPLKVAILGNFTMQKGGNTIARVIPLFENSNIEFHIFGRVEAEFAWLNNAAALPFVHVHGAYQSTALPSELFFCHVSLHLSIWPETYCLTLSEAWDCGLVPIVSDIGALGERVIDGVNGLKIPQDAEGALVQALRRIAETPGLLEELQSNIPSASIARLEPHLDGLRQVYAPTEQAAKLAASVHEGRVELTLAKLHRPVPLLWANRGGVDSASLFVPPSSTFKQRVLHLGRRGFAHLRTHGVRSTGRVAIRFMANRF